MPSNNKTTGRDIIPAWERSLIIQFFQASEAFIAF